MSKQNYFSTWGRNSWIEKDPIEIANDEKKQ